MKKEMKDLYKVANKIFENTKQNFEKDNSGIGFAQIKDSLDKFNKIITASQKTTNTIWNLELYNGYFNNTNVEKIKLEYMLNELSKINYKINKCNQDINHKISVLENTLENKKTKSKRFNVEDIFKELICLKEEYGDNFGISKRDNFIFIITDNVIFKDSNDISYDFGPFRIELYYDSHKHYFVKAIKPLYHRTNNYYTHPHISGNRLCEGDAVEAINIALAEGRLTDFFDIIKSVINTYNPKSPYLPLETWLEGYNCHDCGSAISNEEVCSCNLCYGDIHYCNDCVYYCGSCDEYVCSDHYVKCSNCGQRSCQDCMKVCEDCGCYMCEDCMTTCEKCDDILCFDCSYSCHECDCHVCSSCHETCEECKEIVCKRCLNTCGVCSSKICDSCKKNCETCGEITCGGCSDECNCCNDVVCKDCSNKCEKCSDIICKEHSFSCGKCEKINCDDCNRKCENCEENLCENCSCDCCDHKEEGASI